MIVYILVEGQTEELFVKNCLGPYLLAYDIYIIPIIVSTKRVLSGIKTVGGLSNGNLSKFLAEINRLLYSLPAGGIVTTFIDFYAIPTNFPGYDKLEDRMTNIQRIDFLSHSLHEYFHLNNSFLPYIQLHEFEALMFSHPCGFEAYLNPALGNVAGLLEVINEYDNPELINNNKATSPSHRILSHYEDYNKPLIGNMIVLEIGIDQILVKCPRFNAWIQSLIEKRDRDN